MQWPPSQQGFSLIEMVIAMAISAILITGIYEMFYAQQRSYLAQDQVAEMQQNQRAAMDLLTRDLRSVGFDPQSRGGFGLVTDFDAPNDVFNPDINYATQKNVIAFTTDFDEDGILDTNNREFIAYKYEPSTKTIVRFNVEGTPGELWEPLINNVDALDFVFLDSNGAPTTVLANIRAVEISLLVRTDKSDKHYDSNGQVYKNKQGVNICSSCSSDHRRRRLISTTVQFRNILS
jgi:type IV pilus assembly protein PilW